MRSRSWTGAVAFQRVELVEHAGALGDRGSPCDQQRADRGENPAAPWRGDILALEHALRCRDRVDAIGLPGSAIGAARALDFEDRVPGTLQVLAEPGAPAAGALDSEHKLTGGGELLGPALEFGVAGGGRCDRELGEHLADVIERDGVVAVLVGVDPDCDHPSSSSSVVAGDVETAGQSCVE
jgi:hypothetical protein